MSDKTQYYIMVGAMVSIQGDIIAGVLSSHGSHKKAKEIAEKNNQLLWWYIIHTPSGTILSKSKDGFTYTLKNLIRYLFS